jgi:3-oxoadipate enol-lactonase
MEFFYHDGIRFAYQIDGREDTPPLVLLNSLGTDLRMWQPLIPLLTQQFRVIRYDARGHGQSALASEAYAIHDLGHDLLALLDRLQIERASICGISLGGLTALWFAARYPQRIRRAIFANTAARIGSRLIWDARIAAVRAGGMVAIREAVLARFLSAGYRQDHPVMLQELEAMLLAIKPQGYMAACEVLRETDLRELVQTITVPALILASELDESTPPVQAQELHSAIVGSQLFTFAQVAHLSSYERPEAFSQHLLEFVA